MTLSEIKQALHEGKKVYWHNPLYEVIKDNLGQYLIVCESTDYTIGLTWRDGQTMNGKEQEFYEHKNA